MVISFLNKIILVFTAWKLSFKMPFRVMLKTILKPADFIRYIEFPFILKFIKQHKLQNDSRILDVSSPYLMAYYFAQSHHVLKTDINTEEAKSIKNSDSLVFERLDATNMPYSDNSFDFSYSISVIEHIYFDYAKAVTEMIRVTKSGGYIYLTFPVAAAHAEEWLESDIYSDQKVIDNKVFFQYRFDENDCNSLKTGVSLSANVISECIYWEKQNGLYDKVVNSMQKFNNKGVFGYVINCFLNFWYGFHTLNNKPQSFASANSLGVMHIVFQKK